MAVHIHQFMWKEGFCRSPSEARSLIERKKILYATPGERVLKTLPTSVFELPKGTRVAMTDRVGNILYEKVVS